MSDMLSMLQAEIKSSGAPAPPPSAAMSQEQKERWEAIRQKLLRFKIRCDTKLPDQKHLLKINGVQAFPRGDLVAISGKEKCGKTTACRILVSALLKGEYMDIEAIESHLRILWVDTEQASITTRTVTRGIVMMCGFKPSEEQFLHYSLREYPDREEMQETLDVQFNDYRPDVVIIDGIRDYIDDFNDVVSSSQIVLKCMQLSSGVTKELAAETGLSQRPPCCVITILHQNKPKDDTSMRGHLGTELSNKAGEVWEASRDDDNVFSFTQRCSRTRPVEEPIHYKVNTEYYHDDQGGTEEIGIPEIWEVVPKEPPITILNTDNGPLEVNHDNMARVFFEIMADKKWKYNDLKMLFHNSFKITFTQFHYLISLLPDVVKKDKENNWTFHVPSIPIPDSGQYDLGL